MSENDLRVEIHKLVDTANESQLDAVLEVLKPSESRYTREEIESFYKKADQFDRSGKRGFSVQEAHDRIRKGLKDGL